jgi:glycosyltransferase involved in cell wall biosynthesis
VKIVLFTFYYPPDIGAGSFRAVALVEALSNKISPGDELHVVTTHPNRYATHKVFAKDSERNGNITIHRFQVPGHQSGMLSQVRTFTVFAWHALRYCANLKPDFVIGTTSRLMTGLLAGFSSKLVGCCYFIDLRDIFSAAISDLFSIKSPILGRFMRASFYFFEKLLLSHAAGVNVVSEGFPDYFLKKGVDTSNWSFFPNGVDQEFIDVDFQANAIPSSIKTVLYAGNIGSGQGLELVVPEIAKKLGCDFQFKIVGDGGKRKSLEERVAAMKLDNVELLPPVGREQLIQHYRQADILFLHLNDVPAFKRVLPSKIFEYAVLDKPIVAGLSGYSAQFIVDNIGHASLFKPGDIDSCVTTIKNAVEHLVDHEKSRRFIERYSRERIMERMADHVLSIVKRVE